MKTYGFGHVPPPLDRMEQQLFNELKALNKPTMKDDLILRRAGDWAVKYGWQQEPGLVVLALLRSLVRKGYLHLK